MRTIRTPGHHEAMTNTNNRAGGRSLDDILEKIAEFQTRHPVREQLAAVLVAPTRDGMAYQVDGFEHAAAWAASVVELPYSRDAYRVAEVFPGRRLLVVPPQVIAAIEKERPVTGDETNIGSWRPFGAPVYRLTVAPGAPPRNASVTDPL